MWVRYPVEGYYDTLWLTGHWFTQAKVEDIVLKAAWHWCSDRSVANDHLGEPGLPSAWGFVDGDRMFSPYFVGELLDWRLETEQLSP